jgi:hypothetical protein
MKAPPGGRHFGIDRNHSLCERSLRETRRDEIPPARTHGLAGRSAHGEKFEERLGEFRRIAGGK